MMVMINKLTNKLCLLIVVTISSFSIVNIVSSPKVNAAKIGGMCVIGNGTTVPYYAIRVNSVESNQVDQYCKDAPDGGVFYQEGSSSPYKVCITDPYNQNIPHYELMLNPADTCTGVTVNAGSAIPVGTGTTTPSPTPGTPSPTPPSGTFNPWETTCTPGTHAEESSVCKELNDPNKKNPFDGSEGIIPTIANFMAAIGGLIAIIVIIASGLRMIMSSGDSAKLTQSRNAIIYAAAGIVVIVLARTIIKFVLDRL